MARVTFNGNPGDVWTNNTGRIQYQLIVQWHNTCGLCSQYANAIGPSWPIPFHRGCRCLQVPVSLGAEAKPFVDFRDEIRALDPHQQARVVGKSNWRLIESGKVDWEDVVTRNRVRDLREVVSLKQLTVGTLTKAGVRDDIAQRAFEAVHTPPHELAAKQRAELVARLTAKGITPEQIKQAVAERIAQRVGIKEGPSGPQAFQVTPTTPKAPKKTPAVPKIRKAATAKTPPPQPADPTKQLRDTLASLQGQRPSVINGAVRDWLEANQSTDPVTVQSHGMSDSEVMHSVHFMGYDIRFPPLAGTEGVPAVVTTLRGLASHAPLPTILADATGSITLSTQANKDDPYWRKRYNNPDHVSMATGGDGHVVVYNSNATGPVQLAHESGHNLATKLWGDTEPPMITDYRGAMISGEPPITDYAANSPDEDFAVSWETYATSPDVLKEKSPSRFKVIDEMARSYQGGQRK